MMALLSALHDLFDTLDHEFGRIDVLGNVTGPSPLARPEDLELDAFAGIVHGRLVARFYACQEAGRRMLAARRGSIINLASIGGVTALGRGNIAYSAAMGGGVQMTRELSTEWGSRNVRVNAILGVGRVVAKQIVIDAVNERVAIRQMMFLTLTCDSQTVDIASAARFLQIVKQYVEQPVLWLVNLT